MKEYYHDVDNKEEAVILGYLSCYGDFQSTKDEYDEESIAVIKVRNGLLSCSEYYEQFCYRVAAEARKSLKFKDNW